MNDNRTSALRRPALHVVAGEANTAWPCRCHFCRAESTVVDAEMRNGRPENFFVWCLYCGAAGPETITYDLAVSAWNRLLPLPEALS